MLEWGLGFSTSQAQSVSLSEQLYVDVLLGREALSPLLQEALDLDEDGFVGTADLVRFLLRERFDVPLVAFEVPTSSVGEGAMEPGEVRVLFSEPFTGTLQFSIETMPIVGNAPEDAAPPRAPSAVLGTDYTISGPGLSLGSPDENGVVVASIVLDNTAEASLLIEPNDDAEFESGERIVLYLDPGDGPLTYLHQSPYRHTVFIDENDGVWSGAYLINSSDGPTGDAPMTTAAPLNFQIEFAQFDGAFGNGQIRSDGRGPIPVAPGADQSGWPVSFAGSTPTRLRATFTTPLDAEENRFGIDFVRQFEITAEAGDSTGLIDVFDTSSVIVGTFRETTTPADDAFRALRTVQTGRFILSFQRPAPDILEAPSE